MQRNELAKAIYDISHLEGSFKLRSGAVSNEYFDKYRFESNPELLFEIAKHMVDILPRDFDMLAGLEMGGIPLATALSFQTGKPVVFVRKKAKEYGTCKFAEGPDIRGRKLLIVEDVVTSGGQISISAGDLRSDGAIIEHAVCVIDRESGGPENLRKHELELLPLFNMTELKSMR